MMYRYANARTAKAKKVPGVTLRDISERLIWFSTVRRGMTGRHVCLVGRDLARDSKEVAVT